MPGFLKVRKVMLQWNDCGCVCHIIQATVEWFRIYKMPTGKPPNKFAFQGQAKGKDFANGVVTEMHAQWQSLVDKKCSPGEISW